MNKKWHLIKRVSPAIGLLSLLCLSLPSAMAFSLQDVAQQAKVLSEKPYVKPQSHLPNEYKNLSYADYQKIYFNYDKNYWKNDNLMFMLQFYHQGSYFDTPVKINEIINNKVSPIQYSADYFDTRAINQQEPKDSQLGFAGFKVQFPINQSKKRDDEIFSALGASYFRVVGKGQVYGLSARALAIDTGLMSGEEFPHFSEFWLEKPKAKQKYLVIYALLDSPRVTGAYKFILRPNNEMVIDVESQLYFRDGIEKLGIAPLTSMFLYGKNQPAITPNYRPAIHDSNGLSILTTDNRWIWRPLNNPQKLSFSNFNLDNPKGFGLIQRDDGFSDYQDLDDRYDLRPSAWIEALSPWGKGHVELIEIPTPDETNDNIVSFWVPEKHYGKGDQFSIKYRLHFMLNEAGRYPANIAYAKETLYSLGDVKQANLVRKLDGSVSYVIDFVGKDLALIPKDKSVKPFINISDNGEVVGSKVIYNPVTKGWRVILRFKVKDAAKATEIYVSLLSNDGKDKLLSETWNAQYPAK
ncbi:glucan biosynthesis protein G [Utexia brackfieldae]|uniref:glucan biosynthesis protein G n=1 Tax=Utexia brackfieldae TaxID=3074108 RepID=UPI00370D73D6